MSDLKDEIINKKKIKDFIRYNIAILCIPICVTITYIYSYIKVGKVTMESIIIGGIISFITSISVAIINNIWMKKSKNDYDKHFELSKDTNDVSKTIKFNTEAINTKSSKMETNINKLIDDLNFRKGKNENKIQLNEIFKFIQNVYEENIDIKNKNIELKKELRAEREKNTELSKQIKVYEESIEFGSE